MKIIKQGKWKIFVECHACEAELLADATDIQLHAATQNAVIDEVVEIMKLREKS
jgi:hypothetical protein